MCCVCCVLSVECCVCCVLCVVKCAVCGVRCAVCGVVCGVVCVVCVECVECVVLCLCCVVLCLCCVCVFVSLFVCSSKNAVHRVCHKRLVTHFHLNHCWRASQVPPPCKMFYVHNELIKVLPLSTSYQNSETPHSRDHSPLRSGSWSPLDPIRCRALCCAP